MSYYDELGISPDASDEEIRAAYRRKAKQQHPDRGGDAQKMAAANRAYEMLISPQRRLTYDRTGEDKPAAPTDKVAHDIVLHFMIEWFNNEMNLGDPLVGVRARLDNESLAIKTSITKGTNLVANMKKRVDRLKPKGRDIAQDMLLRSLKAKIIETTQQIERAKDKASQLESAKALLDSYEYERDPAETVTHYSFTQVVKL